MTRQPATIVGCRAGHSGWRRSTSASFVRPRTEMSREVGMSAKSQIPASAAFEIVAWGAQFRDRIAIVVPASPQAIFQALHEVRLSDMKLAWWLGELRYLP